MYNSVYMNTVRTNITFPKDLLLAVDRLVGEGRRSAFLAESVREHLAKINFAEVVKDSAGIFELKDYPHFSTSKKVRSYIKRYRSKNSTRFSK